MAGDLGPGRREAQTAEEPARATLADVAFGFEVGVRTGNPDGVEAELGRTARELVSGHSQTL